MPTKIDPDVVEAAMSSSGWAVARRARSSRASAARTGPVDDPAGQDTDTVRRIVDDVDGRVRELLAELGVTVNG